jgi:photosystem II stability/assembly factor-like uncharacterized protein
VSEDRGSTWRETGLQGECVHAIAVDRQSNFLRSPDAGVTWERWDTSYAHHGFLALVVDPVQPGLLYAATWGGVFRSRDGGRVWQAFSDGLRGFAPLGLVVSPDGKRLYAGTDGGGIFVREILADRPPVIRIPLPRAPRGVPPR